MKADSLFRFFAAIVIALFGSAAHAANPTLPLARGLITPLVTFMRGIPAR